MQTAMDGAPIPTLRHLRFVFALASVALAAPSGCTPYIGTTYKSFLRHVRENPDPNIRYIAYAKLGSPSLYESPAEKDEAVRTLVAKYQQGREPVAIRAAIIRSLGNLGDRRSREVVVRAVGDVDDPIIRVEACRALGKVGLPEDATLLSRIMLIDRLEDCRIAAIEALGTLKANDPRIYQMLLDGMEHDDPAIRFECLRSLRAITGKDFGIEPAAWRRALEPTIAAMPKTPPSASARPPQTGVSKER
jgi:HEAT repeat protein